MVTNITVANKNAGVNRNFYSFRYLTQCCHEFPKEYIFDICRLKTEKFTKFVDKGGRCLFLLS